MVPAPELLDRFERDLEPLVAPGARLGLAVSGGPDSLALLLLAAAARPGFVHAATVDHALRSEARREAEMVAEVCGRLEVPHAILTVDWPSKPESAVQERSRLARYELLAGWAGQNCLDALATAHQLDDQAETFMMRLMRSAGVRGLAGMRPVARVPGSSLPLVRPLLLWRRFELEQVCASAGLDAALDPSNQDEQFERVRIRNALAHADWVEAAAVAASAANLGDADEGLEWAARREWAFCVTEEGTGIVYRPNDAPREIRRRIAALALERLAHEGDGSHLRGRELDQLLRTLERGGSATLRGVLCTGGDEWRFVPAPHRTRPSRYTC